jgi:excinuclease UvrABC ATPase subunit
MKSRYFPIEVVGAHGNNLKQVSLTIDKHQIVVFVGPSGSGKSSLVFDTIAAESQKQFNETYSSFIRHRLPNHGEPRAEALRNLPASIVVDQRRLGGNARSTVGTATDIHALLRLLFSRAGKPVIGESELFSFNNPKGMCPRCLGLGEVSEINLDSLLDRSKSLNQGGIRFAPFRAGSAKWKRFALSGLFDNDKPLAEYSEAELHNLLHATDVEIVDPKPGWYASTRYEGVIPKLRRSYLRREPNKGSAEEQAALRAVIHQAQCPLCKGGRLTQMALSSRIQGRNIADCAKMEVTELLAFLAGLPRDNHSSVVDAIAERLSQVVAIGLDYISLGRPTGTLSGGESQRVKMVRHLGSSLSDIAYIFDEPSVGLHPGDVSRLNDLMGVLRDRGNTVLVVEHDPDVMAIADDIVEIGPGAGAKGGNLVFQGPYQKLVKAATPTGAALARPRRLHDPIRLPTGSIAIRHASLHSVRDVSVDIPTGVLVVVAGVAGSGKSTLVSRMLPGLYPDVISINQSALGGSKRSTPASYTGLLDHIRNRYAGQAGGSASLFSSNSAGACRTCKGLGVIEIDLGFLDSVESTCPTCGGSGYSPEAKAVSLWGKTIAEAMAMPIEKAAEFFAPAAEMADMFQRLVRVGLGYMPLGQRLSSLSGGERQRLRLATELGRIGSVYIFDEPTSGLHLADVRRLLELFDQMVVDGASLIVVEHNLDVMAHADWIIEMGPGAGSKGGKVIFDGPPAAMLKAKGSVTGPFLARYLDRMDRQG